jgi:hypothetical protein
MVKENPNQPQALPNVTVNEHVVQANLENLKLEQNLMLAVAGGAIGALLGAVIWAAVTYFTEYQIGWMAIIVGYLVGFGTSRLGKGLDKIYAITGGVISLFGVALGNFLASMGYVAKAMEMNYLDTMLSFDYSMTFELLKATFTPTDILFYILAIYAGYRSSLRKITREQLLEGAITHS